MKERAKKNTWLFNNWLAVGSIVVLTAATVFVATRLYLRYERGRMLFVCEKTDKDAQVYLNKVLDLFKQAPSAQDFLNKVNQRHADLAHKDMYVWVYDYQRRIVAHGQHPFSPTVDEHMDHFNSNRITIATINNAKTFPVAYFYTSGNRLKRAIVDKVEKDRAAYFVGVCYVCD